MPIRRLAHDGPAVGAEGLDRAEAGLVGHLAASADPIAEVDVGQAELARAFNMPQHDIGAGAALWLARLEKFIDPRQAVADTVGELGPE